jgi:gliding motility-associated-like protein
VDTFIHHNYIQVFSSQTVTSSFTATPLSGCDSVLVNFNNTSNNATSYLWIINQTDSSTLTNASFTYHATGTYFVALIAYNSSPCGTVSDTSVQIITVTVNPSAQALFTPDSTLGCIPFNVNFTNNSTNAISYNWAFGDNNFSTDITPNHTYNSVGTYTVTLIANGAGGCNDTTQFSFISVIQPPIITAGFSADTLHGCNPLTVHFTNTSINGITYIWNFGDSITSTSINPSHTYTDTGLFTVKLMAFNDTSICGPVEDSIIITQYIAVENPVKITTNFDVNPIRGCTPLIVTISNNSSNGTEYLWSFGNGDTSIFKNPFQEFYLDSGTFKITLITYNPNAVCYNPPDTMTVEVHADSCDLFIPNVFSPNGDSKNDVFDFVAEGYTQYHLKIFDRWGLLVFESTDNNIKWNGKINNTGGEAPDGTYYYIFTSLDYNQQPFMTHGFLTLIR